MVRRTLNLLMRTMAFLTAAAGIATAQNLVVDATPSHVANSFRPIRALGAGVDRIGLGLADKMLIEPMLKRDSGFGLAAGHLSPKHGASRRSLALEPARHLERSGRPGLLHWQCNTGGNDSSLMGLHAASPRHEPRPRRAQLLRSLGRRSGYLLEEQSVLDPRVQARMTRFTLNG